MKISISKKEPRAEMFRKWLVDGSQTSVGIITVLAQSGGHSRDFSLEPS